MEDWLHYLATSLVPLLLLRALAVVPVAAAATITTTTTTKLILDRLSCFGPHLIATETLSQ